MRRSPVLVRLLVAAAVLVPIAACSSEGEKGSNDDVELSAEAARGRDLAESNGCTSCHRIEGDDGVGPAWAGLAGSEVQLRDGGTVVADEQYLRTSIVDPNAQVVEGFNAIMPERELDPEEVDALVAYLTALGEQP
jgi:cytochrome c oxidase subunit 2